jgi:hypothetical protein
MEFSFLYIVSSEGGHMSRISRKYESMSCRREGISPRITLRRSRCDIGRVLGCYGHELVTGSKKYRPDSNIFPILFNRRVSLTCLLLEENILTGFFRKKIIANQYCIAYCNMWQLELKQLMNRIITFHCAEPTELVTLLSRLKEGPGRYATSFGLFNFTVFFLN